MKLFAILLILVLAIGGCAVQEPSSGLTKDEMELPKVIPSNTSTPEVQPADPVEQQVVTKEPEEEEEPKDYTEYQQTPKTAPTVPVSFRMDMPKLSVDCFRENCLDYLGAYAMAARYFNKGIDLISVAGYGMMGSDAKVWSNEDIDNNYEETGMITASENYGYIFGLGYENGGIPSRSRYSLKFEEKADKVHRFNNELDALTRLKQAVSSRDPTIVYVEASYLQDDFKKHSSFWEDFPEGSEGRFMVVTGYDSDYVYLNDPNDVDGRDLPALKENFLMAWKTTKFLDERKLGPFWMFYLQKGTQRKVDAEKLIDINNGLSEKAVDELEKFSKTALKSDATCDKLNTLAKTRDLYSDFLERYDRGMASTMYDDASDYLRYACEDGINEGVEKASIKESNAQSAI